MKKTTIGFVKLAIKYAIQAINFFRYSRIKINSDKKKSPLRLMYSRRDFINRSAVLPLRTFGWRAMSSGCLNLRARSIKAKELWCNVFYSKDDVWSVSLLHRDVIRRRKRTKRTQHLSNNNLLNSLYIHRSEPIKSFLYVPASFNSESFSSCQIVLVFDAMTVGRNFQHYVLNLQKVVPIIEW